MLKHSAYFAVAFALTSCGSSHDGSFTQPITVGAGVSSIGLLVEPSYRADARWGFRAPIGLGSISRDVTVEGINYEATASTGGVGVLADYYPTGQNFRVSAGLFKSNIGSTGRASGTVDVGSNTYFGVDIRTRVATERTIAPMISLGYDGQLGAGWGLSADLGAIYTGGFSVDITDAMGIVPESDINAEISSLDDAIDKYTIIPYAKLAATYRW